MTSTAAPEDVKDDLLLQIRRLLDKSKSELQKEWKTMDCSGFEPIAKADLLAALLHRLLRGTSSSDTAQSQLSNSRPPAAPPTKNKTPAKSFKEAITSPARLPAPSPICNDFEKRLAEAELSLSKHKQRFRELDQQAEALDRQNRQLNVILYNVPDAAEEDDQGAATLQSLLGKCINLDVCLRFAWEQERLGTYCPNKKGPRPIRVMFDSLDDKHAFFKHAHHLKDVGLRYDDDLTRLQQQQRQELSADFNILKSKGYKPFYRGSSLKFRNADKTFTCKRDGANRTPDAQL